MRRQRFGPSTAKLWLTAEETYAWATRGGSSWPCSVLSGRCLFVEIYDGDVVDCRVNGKYNEDVPADELSAIIEDHLAL